MGTMAAVAHKAQRLIGLGTACGLAALVVTGCASRTVVEEENPRLPQAPMASGPSRGPAAQEPQDPPFYGTRQSVGAGPVWMDDPAKRRGPQGQPAPFGRDTITGKPLSDLPSAPEGSPPPQYSPDAAPATRPGATPIVAPGTTVVVAKGETLYAIARRHNVSMDALMRANNLSAVNNKIQAGQTLIIPAR
ncbi:MAG: LysM peptidoglycan-binding domain-containing protein [Hyphomicrobiaceae bacterium]